MKTKNILFRFKISGRGVVNYDDSGTQKWMLMGQENLKRLFSRHDNVSLAKKTFFVDDDGNLNYKLKISENSLRHSIFKEDVFLQSPSVQQHLPLLYSYIASPMSVLRGYSFMTKLNSGETLKKKSPVTITDAIQTNNSVSATEVQIRSGEKTIKEGADDKNDNTLFYNETVGDMEYSGKGVIDLMELQFVSGDKMFDRYAFNPDYFEMYRKLIGAAVPNFNSDLKYYTITNSVQKLPEYGFLFSNDNVKYLTKEFLRRLLSMSIKRKGSFADVTEVQIKLTNNVLNGAFGNEEGWVTIDLNSLENLDFEVDSFYTEADFEEVKELKIQLDEAKKEAKEAEKKAKKEAKKETSK